MVGHQAPLPFEQPATPPSDEAEGGRCSCFSGRPMVVTIKGGESPADALGRVLRDLPDGLDSEWDRHVDVYGHSYSGALLEALGEVGVNVTFAEPDRTDYYRRLARKNAQKGAAEARRQRGEQGGS